MPRLYFVKKARKDHNDEIKKGDSYFHWQFRGGPVMKSKTKPTRQDLTQSAFLKTLYDIEDSLAECEDKAGIEEVITAIDELQDETECQLGNMPEHLQDTSPAGILMTERIEGLELWADELRSIIDNVEGNEMSQYELEDAQCTCFG